MDVWRCKESVRRLWLAQIDSAQQQSAIVGCMQAVIIEEGDEYRGRHLHAGDEYRGRR
jgi:hypothetical protein